jgi:signal transduction histidine kinase
MRIAIFFHESSRELLSCFRDSVPIIGDQRGENFPIFWKSVLARSLLIIKSMQSLDTIYLKMYPTLERSALAGLHQESPPPEPPREISREVAHELNNVLTIVRGYSERLLMKHADNAALRADLQLICDNAKRAENVIRQAARGTRNVLSRNKPA